MQGDEWGEFDTKEALERRKFSKTFDRDSGETKKKWGETEEDQLYSKGSEKEEEKVQDKTYPDAMICAIFSVLMTLLLVLCVVTSS